MNCDSWFMIQGSWLMIMTQDEKWMAMYNEVKSFIESNHRNISKYNLEERRLYTWLKHNRKVLNAGGMKEERKDLFEKLLAECEEVRRVNQYV